MSKQNKTINDYDKNKCCSQEYANVITYISNYELMDETIYTNQTSETDTATNFRLLTAPVLNRAFYAAVFSK